MPLVNEAWQSDEAEMSEVLPRRGKTSVLARNTPRQDPRNVESEKTGRFISKEIMKIIRGISQIRKFKNSVIALGVFDGVHVGHRIILKAAVAKARSIKGTSVVLTFWPHPQKEESLYSLEHRLRLIEEIGVDICIVVKFTPKFARITADNFIKNILVKKLSCRYIYVGSNFSFGKDARGNYQTLTRFSRKYNFKLRVFYVVKLNNKPISSTYIRKLVKAGRLEEAGTLLTRPVSILGTVVKGNVLGRSLGFPTANINPHHEVIPPSGVYAVRAILENKEFKGICYIGTRPTLKGKRALRIEVHMFNFQKNIYSRYLEIQFIKKIRDERKFDSLLSLAKQIRKDIISAKKL